MKEILAVWDSPKNVQLSPCRVTWEQGTATDHGSMVWVGTVYSRILLSWISSENSAESMPCQFHTFSYILVNKTGNSLLNNDWIFHYC